MCYIHTDGSAYVLTSMRTYILSKLHCNVSNIVINHCVHLHITHGTLVLPEYADTLINMSQYVPHDVLVFGSILKRIILATP